MSTAPEVPTYDPLAAAPHPETGLVRGRQGRPKLIPRGLSTRIEYTRASALSAYIMGGGQYGLERWQKRLILRGAGIRPDLGRMAAGEHYEQQPGTEKDALYYEAGRNIDGWVEEAIVAAGGHDKANWGTAVHSLVRPGSTGIMAEEDVELRKSVEGFHAAMRGLVNLHAEVFVANDELLTAGTFDGALDIPDGLLPDWLSQPFADPNYGLGKPLLCADWKTGELHIIEHIVQMATYCRGEVYDVDTDERQTFFEAFGRPVRTDVGLVVRIPPNLANHPIPEKRVKLYLVDLEEGYRLAKVAAYVRQMQKEQSLGVVRELKPADIAQARIRQSMLGMGPELTPQALSALYARWKDDWNDELTEFGRGLLEAVA